MPGKKEQLNKLERVRDRLEGKIITIKGQDLDDHTGYCLAVLQHERVTGFDIVFFEGDRYGMVVEEIGDTYCRGYAQVLGGNRARRVDVLEEWEKKLFPTSLIDVLGEVYTPEELKTLAKLIIMTDFRRMGTAIIKENLLARSKELGVSEEIHPYIIAAVRELDK